MSFNDKGQTGSRYGEVRFQQAVLGEMGELLPVELSEACDLENARSVLEIGCGAGEWLRRIAREYPHLQCIGIDQDEGMVKVANALAQQEGLSQVVCFASDLNSLAPEVFPLEKFDLVHLSFLGRFILTVDYGGLARTCAELCRSGGFVCWMEAELPVTSSAAFERLIGLLCEALEQTGQSFIPKSMWEWSALLAKSYGTVGVDRTRYKRRHLGMTPMLGGWLHEARCRALPASSTYMRRRGREYRDLPHQSYAIDLSKGAMAYEGFVQTTAWFLREVRQFLVRMDVIGEGEYDELCLQVERELAGEDFCGLAFVLRVWGRTEIH